MLPGSPTSRRSSRTACVLALAALLGTSPACAGGGGGSAIPDDHPCKAIALPQEESKLWVEAFYTGEPVPLTLLPPLEEDWGATISQGNLEELGTHTGDQQWAWDLEVPVGTAVLAAAPGIVVLVDDDSDQHGPGEEFRELANRVVLDHGGGLFTAYVHLAQGSALVTLGQSVKAGHVLAATGLSGQLGGPHLHFQVENVWSESLPARFVDGPAPHGCTRHPATGDLVYRPVGIRDSLVGPDEPSLMPPDAFLDFAVQEIHGMPGRLVHVGDEFLIEGRADPAAAAVLIPVFHADAAPEDEPITTLPLPIDETGHFAFTFQVPGHIIPPGAYKWAATAAGLDEEGNYVWSLDRMVLLAVAPQ